MYKFRKVSRLEPHMKFLWAPMTDFKQYVKVFLCEIFTFMKVFYMLLPVLVTVIQNTILQLMYFLGLAVVWGAL